MRNRKAVLLSVIAVVLVSACTKRTSAEPSRLIGNLYSGQSLQAVERKLDLSAGDWQVLQDERSLNTGQQKPSRLYVISKNPVTRYGESGELVLTFYNDELVSSQFYAPNLTKVREQVQGEQGIDVSSGEATIAPSTRVWIGRDNSGRSYIGWIDKTRQNEMSGTPAQR